MLGTLCFVVCVTGLPKYKVQSTKYKVQRNRIATVVGKLYHARLDALNKFYGQA